MFSEIIDEAISATGRSSKRAELVGYANATIRECQTKIGKVAVIFHKDMIEDTIEVTDNPHTWEFPRTGDESFRLLRTAYYPIQGVYPSLKPPGRIQEGVDHYYYGGPTYIVFAGVEDEDEINVAYYRYLRPLQYYAEDERPAKFNRTTQEWSYLVDGEYVSTTGTTEGDEAAQNLVSNWMLSDWDRMVLSGTLAKAMLILDDPRAAKHYSLYGELRAALAAAEPWESLNF